MKKILLSILLISCFSLQAHAATVNLSASFAPDNTLLVRVYADPEQDVINAVLGTFSYPTEYFTLDSISTVDSVVSMWLESPKASTSFDVSGLQHIHFEGAIPGGFTGIRSAYYEGTKQGLIMTVTLRAKKQGISAVILEEAALMLHDGNATKVTIPTLTKEVSIDEKAIRTDSKKIQNTTTISNQSLTTFRVRNELVGNNALTLIIEDDLTRRTIDHYEVAETTKYTPEAVSMNEWRIATSPYVLADQKAKTFTHTKAVYADGTRAYSTLAPVENIDQDHPLSRILIGIVSTLLILYVLYAHRKPHTKKGIK